MLTLDCRQGYERSSRSGLLAVNRLSGVCVVGDCTLGIGDDDGYRARSFRAGQNFSS
jgi:hypothetical protein